MKKYTLCASLSLVALSACSGGGGSASTPALQAIPVPTASPVKPAPTASPISPTPTASPVIPTATPSPAIPTPTASPVTPVATSTPVIPRATPTPVATPTASPVYSPVGLYSGTTLNAANGNSGLILIQINSDASGEFSVKFLNDPIVDLTWTAPYGSISGATFTASGQWVVEGFVTPCELTLNATAVSANELDGSYSLIGTSFPTTGTVQFRVVRTLLQSFARQHTATPLF